LVKKSFIFVQSAGMRLAPEVLVLELMRELFFEPHYGDAGGTRYLKPDEEDSNHDPCYSPRERAVLYALKGRRKKTKASKEALHFYAPAYPHLAKRGWIGKKRERVLNNFLLSGPIAQSLWHGGETTDAETRQEILSENIWKALLGNKSCLGQDTKGTDILAATLGPESFEIDRDVPIANLKSKTAPSSDSVVRLPEDQLADTITQDLLTLCDLEPELPRMQWLQLLMTFLRFALPMWILAQMQITSLVHKWLLDAVDNDRIADASEIQKGIATRNRGLLSPTLTPTRELHEHIERYMKQRVELNILVYCLEKVRRDQTDNKKLKLESGGGDELGMEELLALANEASVEIRDLDFLQQYPTGIKFQTILAREGEQFSAWRNPLKRGQGKNIDEFFRVLYKADQGDEAGGHLLVREGRGPKSGFKVFPGQLLLKTMTYLAAKNKWSGPQCGRAGMLILQDVESHFSKYGIDFSTAATARPRLMEELRAMGLLTGSPDAGSSVEVKCPY